MPVRREAIDEIMTEYLAAQALTDSNRSLPYRDAYEKRELRLGLRACSIMLERLLSGNEVSVDSNPNSMDDDNRTFLSISNASKESGVSVSTIRKWTDSGLIEAYRTPGGQRRIPAGAVAKALKESAKPD
jgi:excisionase family DNA binding protein